MYSPTVERRAALKKAVGEYTHPTIHTLQTYATDLTNLLAGIL